MAFSKTVLVSVLISLIVLQLVQAEQKGLKSTNVTAPTGGVATGSKLDCGAACATRCSATKRPKLCQRACGSCCAKCNCVPPGTSGNYQACPCYASLTTHGNRKKCP